MTFLGGASPLSFCVRRWVAGVTVLHNPGESSPVRSKSTARPLSIPGLRSTATPATRPPWVYEGSDGVLEIINGATRATRVAKLAPGTLIRVEVIGKLRGPRVPYTKVGDRL